MSLLRSAIGTVLRRLRHQQGRTLQDVADAAGVSLPYLSEIERGRKEASSEILAGICRALGLALPDLLEQVRAELLRGTPLTTPVRAPRMRVTCGSAVRRAAHGRARRRPPGRAAGGAPGKRFALPHALIDEVISAAVPVSG
jgi:transcriptional regulator with XRE-family HTH domain